MNKLVLSAAAAALFGIMAVNSASASDGTITINGLISATTCTIHGGSPGATSPDFTVTLPSAATSEFSASVAKKTPYSIYIGASGESGCTDGTQVSVHYEPTSPQVDQTSGNLNVMSGAGTAAGVQLQILDVDSSVINLATDSDSMPVTVASNTAELPFFVQYYAATPTAVGPGTADSSVLYSIKYN